MGVNSMSGKWFAETEEAAFQWGQIMTFDPGFIVVEIELPDEVGAELFRIKLLDNIGPARYAELNQLTDAIIIGYKNVS